MKHDAIAELKALALTDFEFRRRVVANPSEALQSVGIHPSQELLDVIKKLVQDLEELGKILGIDAIEFFT
jgi:hypothetical protein